MRATVAMVLFLLARAAGATPPNVVLVLTDDQDVGTMAAAMPQTSALWGAQGITFSNAYATNPLCAASRATLLTGQYPHNHGSWSNLNGYAAIDYASSLGPWVQSAGYVTSYVGKFMNDYGKVNAPGQSGPPCDEVPPGWNQWSAFLIAPHYNHFLLNVNGTVVKHGNASVPPGCVVDSPQANVYSTDKLATRASSWITSHATGAPWFLIVAPYASHADAGPPVAAPRHNGLFANDPFPIPGSLNYNEADVSDKPAGVQAFPLLTPTDTTLRASFHRKRRESLLAVDELVASVEAAIVASGQSSRTVRIFTSDNGWLNGEHRLPGLKTYVYEESARVPLVVRGPGYMVGATRPELVSLADLVPTILALTGATANRVQDGADLGPLLRDDPVSWRTALLIESRAQLGARGVSSAPEYDAVRSGDYVYAEHLSGETELYDLAVDPGQLESKHADPFYQGIAAALSAKLATLRGCVGSGCWQ